MKLQLSDGREVKKCEVFDHEGITVVILDGQRFEFDLMEEEIFQLANPFHDQLGRFAAKTGSVVTDVKEFINAHKKEIVVATAVTATLVVAGVVMYSSKNGKGNVISSSNGIPKISSDVNKDNVPDELVSRTIGRVRELEKDWGTMYNMRRGWQAVFHQNPDLFRNTTNESSDGVKIVDRQGLLHFNPNAIKDMVDNIGGEAENQFKKHITKGFLEASEHAVILLDDDTIQLANPYHDEIGRFASKSGRIATAVGIGIASATGAGVTAAGKQAIKSGVELLSDPFYTASLGVIGASIALNKFKYSKEQNAQYDKFKTDAANLVPEGYKNPALKVRQHSAISTYVLASTDPVFGNQGPLIALSAGFVRKVGNPVANISPQVKRWALDTSDSPESKVRRDFAEGVIVHESLHTRPRTGSMNIINARFKMGIEEGLNDTLTERFTKKGSTSAYAHYRDGMTKIAMTLNDNDRKKALQWIDDAHKKSIGPIDISRQLSTKTGQTVHWWDVHDYVTKSSVQSGETNLTGVIGNKSGYARQFNSDIIKKRPSLALDLKMQRVITGAIESSAAWYVGYRTTGAIRQVVIAGVFGALNDIEKQRKLLEDIPTVEPDFLDFLSRVESLEQLMPVVQEAKHRAVLEGIDPLEIELAFQYALSTITLGNASAEDDREESVDELTEMVNEIDSMGNNILSDDENA